MVGKDEARTELIDRMLGARTVRDVDDAEVLADRWLDENPGDPRVLAAQERLEEMGAKIRDPEQGADRATLVEFVVAFSVAASVVFMLTGMPYAALIVGLIVAFGLPWDGVGEAIAEWRRGAGLLGRGNVER